MTPPGDWANWLCLAGRGWGKTRTGAEDVGQFGLRNPHSRIAIIGPSFGDGRDTCVEGESGLLSVIPGPCIQDWNRSLGELILINQSRYKIYSAETPNKLRGPQHHRAWSDEIGSWRHAEDTWDMLQFGLRLGKNPQNVVTSTPMPIKAIRDLVKDPNTVISTGSTYENQENLPAAFFRKIIAKYEGTRLGLQEIYAKILDDIPGALWQRLQIENTRLRGISPAEIAKKCRRIVVAIDPAVTSPKNTSSDKEDTGMDETGIVAVGIDEEQQGYVLADESCRDTPQGWARRAINLLKRFNGDRIIGEVNNGGDLVEEVIRMVDSNVPYRKVSASRGKFVRAEPISALYEQERIHHVGLFERLEDQMCTFTPENIEKKSPDRADALVWGFTELFDGCSNLGLLVAHKQKIAASSAQAAVKLALAASGIICDTCGSSSVAKISGQSKCNQCGRQFGGAQVMVLPGGRKEMLRGLQ